MITVPPSSTLVGKHIWLFQLDLAAYLSLLFNNTTAAVLFMSVRNMILSVYFALFLKHNTFA